MLTPPQSVEEALDWLRKAFRAEAAETESIRYQFVLTGDEPARLWIDVNRGRLDLGIGVVAEPSVTLRMAADDFFGVLAGNENPDLLFMEERFEVEGELAIALRLRKLFRTPI